MRGGFRSVRVVFICGVLVAVGFQTQAKTSQPNPRKHAQAARGDSPNGEIAVDVTVRRHPRLSAPGITDLPAGTPVRGVRSKAPGWTRIVEPMRGWIPSETYAVRGENLEQTVSAPDPDGEAREPLAGPVVASPGRERRRKVRRLRSQPAAPDDEAAAAPGLAPPAPAQDTDTERTEADLMLEALTATRGESPNAARIARVVDETAKEAKRKRIEAPVPTYWKDPFVDDSEPPALVRSRRGRRSASRSMAAAGDGGQAQTVQSELIEARREAARARAETAAARAEAAATRADAARAKAELARREAAAAQAEALAAKHAAEEARAGCEERPARRRALLGRGAAWREAAIRESSRSERVRKAPRREQVWHRPAARRIAAQGSAAEASTESAPVPARALSASTAAAVLPAAEEPAPAPPPVPPQPSSAGYRGILVVPIN